MSFAEIFNRLSPDLTFNDEVILLIAPALLKRFGKDENYEEIRNVLKNHRDQFGMDELESALEGGIHARNVWNLEFSLEEFLKPLRTLNELVKKNQNLMRVSLNTLSALEAPMKEKSCPGRLFSADALSETLRDGHEEEPGKPDPRYH